MKTIVKLTTVLLVVSLVQPVFAQGRRRRTTPRATSSSGPSSAGAPSATTSSTVSSTAPASATSSAATSSDAAAPAGNTQAVSSTTPNPSDGQPATTETGSAAQAGASAEAAPSMASESVAAPAAATTASVEAEATAVPKAFAIEVGPVLGLNVNVNHSRLGLGPNLGLEAGVRVLVGPGFLSVAVRGHYERYRRDDTGTLPCMPAMGAPDSPCIATNGGRYEYSLVEQTVTLGLPIAYRLLPSGRIHPYVQVQPQVVLERADVTTFQLTNVETATRVGVLGALGGQLDVGPGGVWLEAGYRWVGLPHRSTGDASIGVLAFTLGYRFAF